MSQNSKGSKWIVLLLLLVSCGESDRYELPTDLMSAEGTKEDLVFIDRGESKAYLLEVMGKTLRPEVKEVELPANPFMVQKRKGTEQLLVLCSGRGESEGEEGEASSLALLEDSGVVGRYEIASAFNTMSQSEDGRYVFVYLDKRLVTVQGRDKLVELGQNAAMIDLESEGEEVRTVILGNSQGDVPLGVSFSPAMTVEGKSRRLAVIYSTHLVWILDLGEPGLPPITVEPEVGRTFDFEQVEFDPSMSRIYLRGISSESIQVIGFSGPTEEIRHNGFTPTVRDPRLVGNNPTDMALYEQQQGGERRERLLVLSDGNRAEVLSTDNSDQVSIYLDRPANRILIYYTMEDTAREHPYALLYSGVSVSGTSATGASATLGAVTFVDLGTVKIGGESWLQSESVETVYLERGFNRVDSLGVNDYALLQTEGSTANSLSLLDLSTRNIYPIESQPGLSVLVDEELSRLWLLPGDGGERLGYLDLNNLVSEDVLLDAPVRDVLLFGSGSQRRLAVVHPSQEGYVTVMDAQTLKRSEATSLQGFFISKLLDRGE